MPPLRQRMIEDMPLRNLGTGTQRAYLHHLSGSPHPCPRGNSTTYPPNGFVRKFSPSLRNGRLGMPKTTIFPGNEAPPLGNATLAPGPRPLAPGPQPPLAPPPNHSAFSKLSP
jgi:hypothetical protein